MHSRNTKVLTSLAGASLLLLSQGCKEKEAPLHNEGPAKITNNIKSRAELRVEEAGQLLHNGLSQVDPEMAKFLLSVPVEISSERRITSQGNFSAGQWSPDKGVIYIGPEIAESADPIMIAVIRGHELCHAKWDKVLINKLSRPDQCSSEIRAHDYEAAFIIPAVRGELSRRGLEDQFNKVSLDLLESNARFASMQYQIKRDIYLTFEAVQIPKIQLLTKSSEPVSEEMFNLLKTVNTRWKTATEPRQRSRSDFVGELDFYLKAVEEASKHPNLKSVFSESTSSMVSWKQLYSQYKRLGEEADNLSARQAALR